MMTANVGLEGSVVKWTNSIGSGGEMLDLSHRSVGSKDVEQELMQHPKLKKLDLTNTNVTSLDFLRRCPELTHLSLASCHLLMDDAFVLLEDLQQLSHFDCSGCRGFNDRAVSSLSRLTHLQHCDLSDCTELTDDGIASLPPSIQYLSLRGLPNLTENALVHVQKFDSLISLDLSQNCFLGNTLKKLVSLTQLDTLYLWQCRRLKDADLSWLEGKVMRRVDVSFCTQLTNIALRYFQKVNELSLDGCQYLTDDGLFLLSRAKHVRTVSFERCPRITSNCRKELEVGGKELSCQKAFRKECDQDASMGYLRDLHTITIQAMSGLVESYDWRSLAWNLGFDTFSCRRFSSLYDVLTAWLERNQHATLKRLYFEAALCHVPAIERFLQKIPLEFEKSKLVSSKCSLDRATTFFDLQRIDELMIELSGYPINWQSSLDHFGKGKQFPMQENPDPRYLIAAHGDVPLETIVGGMTMGALNKAREQFIAQIESAKWQPTSSGGITYSEIDYLASIVKTVESTSEQESRALDYGELKRKLSLSYLKESHVTFASMLFLFWQHDKGAILSLADFVQVLVAHCADYSELREAIMKGYTEIRSYRLHKATPVP